MSEKKGAIGIPTVKGLGSTFKSFGIGVIGGLVFLLAYQLFGFLGVLAAPLLAGTMIKGERGETIATMSGFLLLAIGVMGMSQSSSSSSGASNEVM